MGAERLTEIGAVLADRTRATLLVALMDGRAHTAGELARHAGVAPSTVSGHLGRLLDADFVAQEAQGRHRYFRLAGREVAAMLEALGAADSPERRSAAPGPQAPSDLIYARSCYDHLAGTLAVRLHDRLLADDHLRSDDDGRLVLTVSGEALLAGLGIDTGALRRAARPTARSCLDWTERRHHLAGAAGTALFDASLARRWLVRGARPRSIRVTDAGQRGLHERFGL